MSVYIDMCSIEYHTVIQVLIGNFDDKLISTRSTGFESLLKLISSECRLLNATAVLCFLQDFELNQAKELIKEKRIDMAIPVLENNFRILNKVRQVIM